MSSVGREFEGRVIMVNGEAAPPDTELRVELRYDSKVDPFAVIMTFFESEDHEGTPWIFGRELMEKGMKSLRPVGDGDVKFRRKIKSRGGQLQVCLSTDEGHAHVDLPGDEVHAFLDESFLACMPGQEGIDAHMDAFLKEITG